MELNKNDTIAIIGVSKNPEKYGYKVYSNLKKLKSKVYPINPKYKLIDNEKCYSSLNEIPEKIDLVVSIVKPEITEKIVKTLKEKGIKKIWMQPGSESKRAIEFCKTNNIKVIHNACIMLKNECFKRIRIKGKSNKNIRIK